MNLLIAKAFVRNSLLASAAIVMAAADFSGEMPSFFGKAEAWVGQPWTPRSAAGLDRRTVVRRSTNFVATLPPSCERVKVNGTSLWYCGGTHYQRSGGRYVVVYVR